LYFSEINPVFLEIRSDKKGRSIESAVETGSRIGGDSEIGSERENGL
jgi:hypothetical protein